VSHYDQETIALLALGEPGATADDAAHLSTCARCRSEVDALSHVVATGRGIHDDDYPVPPPAAVWDRIVDEIRRDDAVPGADAPVATVVPISSARTHPRRDRRVLAVAAAAAIGLIVGGGVAWSVARATAPAAQTTAQGRASVAALHPLDTPAASGTAVVRVASAQARSVSVTVENLPDQPGTFYEVWLMDPANSHLVSLGVLGADGRGSYVVPSGLNLNQYSAVDVSRQQMNGSPEHSGYSAVRGTIPT
jgi:hypothetical protein